MNIKKILVPFALAFAASPLLLVKTHAVVTNPEYEVGTKAEAFYVEFEKNSNETYEAYYKNKNDLEYTKVDQQLVRVSNDNVRIDVVGLSAGTYSLKLNVGGNFLCELSDIKVKADDRSGYAHWNNIEGVGAYKNDGTLKNGATVIYVDESTKNNVDIDGDGVGDNIALADILKNASSYAPLDVRIIGQISAATWNPLTVNKYYDSNTKKGVNPETAVKGANNQYLSTGISEYSESNIINGGYNTLNTTTYSKMNGLENKISFNSSKNEFDSYYNMLDISNVSNVTVEGIGEDAMIFQWGLTWKRCHSIEVKNITFDDYPEDACAFEGNAASISTDTTSYDVDKNVSSANAWVHNCTFNQGKNYWDVSSEQDKHEGDGSTDVKRQKNYTFSYNYYNDNHKTGLVGSGNGDATYNVTYHHNWYQGNQSRMPYARQANIHMYNNFYDTSTGTTMQIHSGAYAFIENCYFKNDKKRFEIKDNGYRTPAIKSYNNVFDGGTMNNAPDIVYNRTTAVSNGNLLSPTFDTDPDLFYYDSTNNRSNVTVMNDATELPELLPEISGAGNFKETTYNYSPNNTELTEIDLGYQTGTYYKGEVQYKAVRFIGIIKYGDAISANDIESINLTIKVYDLDGDVVKTINKEITSVYTELTANDVVVAAKEDNVRYFFSIVNEITSAHTGYRLICEASISMNLGANYYSSEAYTIA